MEDFPHLVQDDSADCSSNFQSAFEEFGDDSPYLATTLFPSVPCDDASLAILSSILQSWISDMHASCFSYEY
jgi:hypothetical protein